MAWIIILGVIALPVMEIALFVKAAQAIGVIATVALAILAGAAGMALVRRQGFETAWRARQVMNQGQLPIAEAFDSFCVFLAGGLLLLPGFFSDFLALLLLLPPVRHALRAWLGRHLKAVVVAGRQQGPSAGPTVIEGDYTVVEGDNPPPDRNRLP